MLDFTDTLQEYAANMVDTMSDGLTKLLVSAADGMGSIASKTFSALGSSTATLAYNAVSAGSSVFGSSASNAVNAGLEDAPRKVGNFIAQSASAVASIPESIELGREAFNSLPENLQESIMSIAQNAQNSLNPESVGVEALSAAPTLVAAAMPQLEGMSAGLPV